jgi:hypothetical protein
VQLRASFSGTPAAVTIDRSAPSSYVSNSFLNTLNIAWTVVNHNGVGEYSCFGPVMIPTPRGWLQSTMLFKASPTLSTDVVLGVDWMDCVRPDLTSVGVRDPLPEIYRHFPLGHAWIPSPTGQ